MMPLSEVTQTNGNTIAIAVIGIVIPALYWYSRHLVDTAKRKLEADAAASVEEARSMGAANASLQEELARKRLVLIEAEEQVKRLNTLAEEAALSRLELIRDLSRKIEEEDARQRDLRHAMRDENRKANVAQGLRLEEAEANLRAANLKWEQAEANLRTANARIEDLEARLASLESRDA